MSTVDLGRVGVAVNLTQTYLDEAAELERLGYGGIWVPGGQLGTLDPLQRITAATSAIPVAPAVISADVHTPAAVSQLFAGMQASAPGRLMVGLGGPQRPPSLQAVHDYLDALDRGQPPVPVQRRLLAALGPRKLELAGDRCAGAIALLVTPEWTTRARHALGDSPTLIIDQMVVLDPDPQPARATARAPLRFLSTVPGYRANFSRMGFAEAEIDGLADRLVDTLVTCADTNAVAQRIDEHLQAGASHVFLTVLADSGQPDAITVARQLAATR